MSILPLSWIALIPLLESHNEVIKLNVKNMSLCFMAAYLGSVWVPKKLMDQRNQVSFTKLLECYNNTDRIQTDSIS